MKRGEIHELRAYSTLHSLLLAAALCIWDCCYSREKILYIAQAQRLSTSHKMQLCVFEHERDLVQRFGAS